MCRCAQVALVANFTQHCHSLAVESVAIGRNRPVGTVNATGIADENSLFLHRVSALSMGSTWVDGVLVIEAPADCVAFHNLVAHVEAVRSGRGYSRAMCRCVDVYSGLADVS